MRIYGREKWHPVSAFQVRINVSLFIFFILQKKKLRHIIPPGHFPNFEHVNLGTGD